MKRAALVTLSTAALVATLAACSSGSGEHSGGHGQPASQPAPSVSTTARANAADITFAQQMIVHHAQAIEMAKLAPTRAGTQKVKGLAARIQNAQQPEIDKMTGWLRAWGQPVAAPGGGHGGHGSMPGVMSDDDMRKLAAASGTAFDRMFLTMMIAHHEGAVTMARTEKESGVSPEARALAEQIIKDQTAEITEMRGML
ncbi:DUF305 domain-containing protein [Longispora albida]|uniref:DUF305 domain-containing protein n=1 Tax=Longispora albida TaxID=203523 RepID=UPI00037FD823|nr:DUF305 domain-containing protein [Longispora albida]